MDDKSNNNVSENSLSTGYDAGGGERWFLPIQRYIMARKAFVKRISLYIILNFVKIEFTAGQFRYRRVSEEECKADNVRNDDDWIFRRFGSHPFGVIPWRYWITQTSFNYIICEVLSTANSCGSWCQFNDSEPKIEYICRNDGWHWIGWSIMSINYGFTSITRFCVQY